ncbi:hypothetical protein M0802_014095 [Mischocyttarus mexicanus]|nr:hypothetical protein M0802_014102 [Mischocyttarus mexicanus]KAI4480964.1 hypothetical protein M0802_014095 [Mischocyttarus mexicanus]
MESFVVFRSYIKEDEPQCKKLLKNGTMTSINKIFSTIFGVQNGMPLLIWICAATFYFVVCVDIYYYMIIPAALVSLYLTILAKMWRKVKKIQQEVSDIMKIYMSDKSTCFWVAETFKLRSIDPSRNNYYCIFITEEELNEYDINVFAYDRKIIATIGLCKHNKIPNAAIIKRLFVHEEYRRAGVGSRLLNLALMFANNNKYDCTNIMISKYMNEAMNMVINRGFKFHMKHTLDFYNSLMAKPNYEYTYPLKHSLK